MRNIVSTPHLPIYHTTVGITLGVLVILTVSVSVTGQKLVDALPCDSEIFCDGPLLEAAQNAYIYNDSKTFVDLHLKYPPDEILAAFDDLDDPTDPELMRMFVETYFDGPNLEFTEWIPTDWEEDPAFLNKIDDASLRDWADELHALWKELGKKVNSDVLDNQDRYTLIYVEQPFVVPGGRFRELYYWDSYWVIKGLLISSMTETVKGMLLNFADLVDKLGFVPNANRIYQANRSQPPFFIPSVYEYYKTTGDFDFVKSLLPTLENEYSFWMSNRSVHVQKPGSDETHLLNRYDVFMGKPRPESYREDIVTCASSDKEESARICSDLASGVETGWGYGSRWFDEDKPTDLKSIRTKQIVPVELNSILCMNEKILADMFAIDGQQAKADEYTQAHIRRRQAIQEVLWAEDTGAWLDYDLELARNRNEFYPSNVMPLWANCYAEGDGDRQIEEKVLNYMKDLGVLDYPGGIPSSLINTGQQWDYPNAWPPIQEMVIQALESSSVEEAREYAFKLAQNWTTTNWRGYLEKNVMYEKYNVEKQGVPGHGGEAEVQAGFGWTNGVMLTLLEKYGDRLTSAANRVRFFDAKTLMIYLLILYGILW
ncbi:trehalase-like [Amphiura filiformis]|uniref:trehalase-like n=1 Tax=Amphiura filiformis TaxID=82378 RepID=UPI003B20FA4D